MMHAPYGCSVGDDGLTQASNVNCVVKSRLSASGMTTLPLVPSNLNACPTIPAANVTPPWSVPLLPSIESLALPSADHSLTKPPALGGGGLVLDGLIPILKS